MQPNKESGWESKIYERAVFNYQGNIGEIALMDQEAIQNKLLAQELNNAMDKYAKSTITLPVEGTVAGEIQKCLSELTNVDIELGVDADGNAVVEVFDGYDRHKIPHPSANPRVPGPDGIEVETVPIRFIMHSQEDIVNSGDHRNERGEEGYENSLIIFVPLSPDSARKSALRANGFGRWAKFGVVLTPSGVNPIKLSRVRDADNETERLKIEGLRRLEASEVIEEVGVFLKKCAPSESEQD